MGRNEPSEVVYIKRNKLRKDSNENAENRKHAQQQLERP